MLRDELSEAMRNPGFTLPVAEKALIAPLLDLDVFQDIRIRRLLASYPSARYRDKNELICRITERLWPTVHDPNMLQVFRRFEHFLLAAGKRGHFVHQFEVFLLGLNAWRIMWRKSQVPRDDFKVESFDELVRVWLLTAVGHDLGYPLEVATKMVGKLSDLYRGMGLGAISERFAMIDFKEPLWEEPTLQSVLLKEDRTSLRRESLAIDFLMDKAISETLGMTGDDAEKVRAHLAKKRDHGVASAAMLARSTLGKLVKSGDPTCIEASPVFHPLLLSVGAVAVHNAKPHEDPEIVNSIAFNRNPYAYVLFAMDKIQDWSRMLIPDEDYPDYILTKFHAADDGRIELSYNVVHRTWPPKVRNSFRKEVKKREDMFGKIERNASALGVSVHVKFQPIGERGQWRDPIQIAVRL